MNSLDFLIPWRSSTIPDGALRITKQERDREEEAIAFLEELAKRLKSGQPYWNKAECDQAPEMMRRLGAQCLIGDQTTSSILKQMLDQPSWETYRAARQNIQKEDTVSHRYQHLFNLVINDPRSDQEKRQILYSALKRDPVAMLACVSHPITYYGSAAPKNISYPYQLMEYIFQDKNAWQTLVRIALGYYKMLTLDQIEDLSRPIIEKTLPKSTNWGPEEEVKKHRKRIDRKFIKEAIHAIESNHIPVKELDRALFLHTSARMKNLHFVKYLIQKGVKVNYADRDLNTALQVVIDWHFFEDSEEFSIVECLLKNGANPNLQTIFGDTPLLIAAETYPEVVPLLIQANADVNLLRQAAHNIESLVEEDRQAGYYGRFQYYHFRINNDHNSFRDPHDSPLYVAIKKRTHSVIQPLLQSGATTFFGGENLLAHSQLTVQEQEELQTSHSEHQNTLRAILKKLNLPLEDKDSDEYSDALLQFTLQAVCKAYSWKRHFECIHGTIIKKTKLFSNQDLHAQKLFILIRHLMFLCYGLHPLKSPDWPQELQVNIKSPPKDVKEFSTWAEQFIGILVTQKEFDFTWAKLEMLAQFPIEIIERYLLFAWRNRAVSEIKEVISKELQNYMEHDQYRFFVESRINFENKSDKLERFFKRSLPPAP